MAASSKKSETLEFRVPFETKERFKDLAASRGETVSTLLRQLVEQYILEPASESVATDEPRRRRYSPRLVGAIAASACLAVVTIVAASQWEHAENPVLAGGGEPSGEPSGEPMLVEP